MDIHIPSAVSAGTGHNTEGGNERRVDVTLLESSGGRLHSDESSNNGKDDRGGLHDDSMWVVKEQVTKLDSGRMSKEGAKRVCCERMILAIRPA